MDAQRKKELISQYKQTRPDMGIFIIRCKVNNKYYLEGTQNLKGRMNGAKARLAGGLHLYRELQKEWNELGEENFTFEVLENLEYDKEDEAKTDYTDDLVLLQMEWEEKLAKEGLVPYSKRVN
ncbi:MAG: GIY-YIG nuclease family protein [Peptococcia bacterium]|jgi:hypothetical protein